MFFTKYVRRSVALRKQRSAYVGMRKEGALSVKPGGTAGFITSCPSIVAEAGFFIFSGGI